MSEENNLQIKNILEAAIMVADEPLSIDRMLSLFSEDGGDPPERRQIKDALESLDQDYADRGIELKQVASGYRLQAKSDVAKWVNRLWIERPAKYTRALLETLAIIAYRQPITRGEIEAIRGVSVSSNVVKTLLEREWIKVAGHRDVPGRPAVFATTRHFLDYFNLKSLSELPSLAELRDLDEIATDLFQEPFDSVVKPDLEEERKPDEPDDQPVSS
ncbi:MAG: SMC-Scp complex subunit ScpB [Gammaproteobacteria bacterium]